MVDIIEAKTGKWLNIRGECQSYEGFPGFGKINIIIEHCNKGTIIDTRELCYGWNNWKEKLENWI